MSEERQMKHDIEISFDQLPLDVSIWQGISTLILNTPTQQGAWINTQEFMEYDKGLTW